MVKIHALNGQFVRCTTLLTKMDHPQKKIGLLRLLLVAGKPLKDLVTVQLNIQVSKTRDLKKKKSFCWY